MAVTRKAPVIAGIVTGILAGAVLGGVTCWVIARRSRGVSLSEAPQSGHGDPEMAKRSAENEQRAFASRFLHESPDAAWSGATEETIGSALAKRASSLHFDNDPVECKTTICAATLHWQSYEDAKASWRHLLVTDFHPCGASIYLPDASSKPYDVVMYFDCPRHNASLDADAANVR
jgi:hypothetical protein